MQRSNVPKIVLTGGPGAGKTAVLEIARKALSPQVAVLPEAASIVFGGGFWRRPSPAGRLHAQRSIFFIQREMEALVDEEEEWKAALCDRGTLDGLAYWPGSEADFFTMIGRSLDEEYQRYHRVIHLRTPQQRSGYNHQNPLRTETVAEALKIDQRIRDIWSKHPSYVEIPSTENFLLKAELTVRQIVLALPETCNECF